MQHRSVGMDFGGASPKACTFNTRSDSSTPDGHHPLPRRIDPAQEQMQALVAEHGGRHGAFNTDNFRRRPPSRMERGQPVAMVSVGARNAAWHFQQQNGAFLDRPRPGSVYTVRRSNRESNFEQETQHGNLIRRLNQMPTVQTQVPVNHVAQPVKFPYSYRKNPSLSYRAYLDSFRSNPLYVQPRCTDSQPHQNPHSNRAMSPAIPNAAAPEQFPSCYVEENVLRDAGVPRSVTGPPKSDALAAKRNGGRRRGPLREDARAHAASTRHDGSCWLCKIQRSKVSVYFLSRIVHKVTYSF